MGLKKMVTDLIRSGEADLNPELSFVLKVFRRFARARHIRNELYESRNAFLERFLNYTQNWRDPHDVRVLCHSETDNVWMRYDRARVEALFKSSKQLLTEAAYRTLIKKYSTRDIDKDERLRILNDELEQFEKKTIRSITTDGIIDGFMSLAADYYKDNIDTMEKLIRGLTRGGALGLISDATEPKDEAEPGEPDNEAGLAEPKDDHEPTEPENDV